MALIQQKFQNIGSGDLSSTASRPYNTPQSVYIDFEKSIENYPSLWQSPSETGRLKEWKKIIFTKNVLIN